MAARSTLKALFPIPARRVLSRLLARFPRTVLGKRVFASGWAGGRWVTVDQMQSELARAGKARSIAEVEFLKALGSFFVELPPPPGDPWSDEYRQHWLSVYRSLTKNAYDVSRERLQIDVPALIKRPYPYLSGSHEIVGNQLIAIGSLIRAMQLPPGASVLELGAGWGNTSLALAQMGYDVTTIDIESNYIELLRARAAMLGVTLNVVQGEFFDIREMARSFDAILFFESFHHCSDHLALLDEIPAKLLPGGKLVLAGETINENIPYDWGLNPSGEAIFQIVTHGWMELAFRESYLLRTLGKKGWKVEKHDSTLTAAAIAYVCTRRSPARATG
jgi:2-polyprenyl-3-methyl-5-hydroxy-6-metoxy-1,4-benzoquinol methylase